MALHLIKLAVGIESVDHLRIVHDERAKRFGSERFTETRMVPRRTTDLLAGGSLYWVIKGRVAARQSILDFVPHGDGRRVCRIMLGEVISVVGQPRRAFQGWRYLSADDAPPDSHGDVGEESGPMTVALRTLGLL